MSYIRYLCLFGYRAVEHILCCVFCYAFPHLVYPMLPVFSGLSIFDYPFGILKYLFAKNVLFPRPDMYFQLQGSLTLFALFLC